MCAAHALGFLPFKPLCSEAMIVFRPSLPRTPPFFLAAEVLARNSHATVISDNGTYVVCQLLLWATVSSKSFFGGCEPIDVSANSIRSRSSFHGKTDKAKPQVIPLSSSNSFIWVSRKRPSLNTRRRYVPLSSRLLSLSTLDCLFCLRLLTLVPSDDLDECFLLREALAVPAVQ
jgi:hypothetical protein